MVSGHPINEVRAIAVNDLGQLAYTAQLLGTYGVFVDDIPVVIGGIVSPEPGGAPAKDISLNNAGQVGFYGHAEGLGDALYIATPDYIFDSNGDGEVDAVDFEVFEACLSGDIDSTPECGCLTFFDADTSRTLDCDDLEAMRAAWTAPTGPPTLRLCARCSRYAPLRVQNLTDPAAIRLIPIELPSAPTATGTPLWLGQPRVYPDEDASDPLRSFVASGLSCDPYITDWSTSGEVHVFGAEITPGAVYEVEVALSGPGGFEFTYVTTIMTGRWGDVAPLFDGEDPGAPQPDFNDIAAIVKKFLGDPSAPRKSRAQLVPNTVLPDRPVDFKDIAAGVSAFVGIRYSDLLSSTGPCACPSAVSCGTSACASDIQCADGICIGGFCTDACGRCAP